MLNKRNITHGDTVRVISNESHHRFNIGDTLDVRGVNTLGIRCVKVDIEAQEVESSWMLERDVELLKIK